jgi:hypothetical protein
MTTPIYMPPPVEDEKPSRGYLNPMEGMSGIGRAMRDKYMAQQAAEDMMRRPLPPARYESASMQRPTDEVYKKGGRVKRKSDMLHRSNADHVKKHYAVGGFMHHSDHAKKLCGGGYMKGKK